MLTREQILAKKARLNTETISVPEWEGDVTIRELTARQAEAIAGRESDVNTDTMVRWVVASVIDPATFQPLFTEADIEWMGEMSAAAIMRIGMAAVKLNGFRKADVEKNSQAREGDSAIA